MLELSNITLSRGAKTLIRQANARVHKGQRVGLIGQNGSGKSSLMSLIRGEIDADQGECLMPEGWTVASVRQETPAFEISALDYVLAGHKPYQDALQTMQACQGSEDGIEIARAHEAFAQVDGYALPAKAASLLNGLGFPHAKHQQMVAAFSGGWRMRLNLAQALLAPADMLLLDEPTNHLDLDAVIWLQDFLRQHPATQLIIAHDREFLDALCQQIWHIEHQQLQLYSGNYSQFERERHERRAQADAQYQKNSARRAHLQKYIDRFRAQATKAKQAQSRIKALEKLSESPPPPPEHQYHLQFHAVEQPSNPLLKINHAQVGYDHQPVLSDIHLSFANDSRIGLLGRNGAGKSTFMKLLANVLPPLSGECIFHPHTRIGYFTQHQLDALDPEQSALAHLASLHPEMSEQAQRNFLGGYGFGGESVEQPVALFSGGEKARLALALVISERPNLLLLDEPTNHLDIGMRDALTEALQTYNGAMIIISHDRTLLRSVCDEFYLVAHGKVSSFNDDLTGYHHYLVEQQKQDNPTFKQSSATQNQSRREQRREQAKRQEMLQPLKKKVNHFEDQVEQTQHKLDEIEQALIEPALYEEQAKDELLALLDKQATLKQHLASAEQQWLDAAQALEDAQSSFLND